MRFRFAGYEFAEKNGDFALLFRKDGLVERMDRVLHRIVCFRVRKCPVCFARVPVCNFSRKIQRAENGACDQDQSNGKDDQ